MSGSECAVPEKLDQRSLSDALWPGLEKHYANLHLGPVAAFFALAEAHYDAPLGYHASPPLAPMVHYGRSPAEFPLKVLVPLANDGAVSLSKMDPVRVPSELLSACAMLAKDCDDDAVCHCGILLARKYFSRDWVPILKSEVVDDVLPRLIELVDTSPNTQLVTEAIWALVELAQGSYDKIVFHSGALEAIMKQGRTTTSQDVAEFAGLALSDFPFNLHPETRDVIHNIVERFPGSDKALAKAATWRTL